ncbi:NUDIX domain-containing protein [Patescibacteria group bacterium]
MWKTNSSKEIFNHPRLTLIEDEVTLPSGVKTNYLKYKDDGSCCVTIITKNKKGEILLQREYSYPLGEKIFQFPGGGVPADEKPQKGANRELAEEMGLHANSMKPLGSYLMNNRRSKKRMHVYLATELVEKSLEADQEEEIEAFWFSESKIARMIKNGEIINIHSLASWCLYRAA